MDNKKKIQPKIADLPKIQNTASLCIGYKKKINEVINAKRTPFACAYLL